MSLCLIPTAKAYGYAYGEKTNTVDVYVGYFGSTYAYIGTMTEDEMQNYCECGEWTYSSIDNGGYTRYNLAYGVTLNSLLAYLNVATSDIKEIYFLGTDNDYYAGFTNLFGTRHYYYPNLAENYIQEDPDASNTNLINTGRTEVPSILAFEQSLYRDSGAFDYNKYKSMMDDDECLRIVFGQTTWGEISTSDSVKWVYEIAIQLKGSPITVENMELEYGSSAALSDAYTVDSGYEQLDEVIQNGLKIQSLTPNIVTVDANGTLHAVGSGEGRILIEYNDGEGSFSDTLYVKVGPEPEDGTGNGGDTGSSSGERDPGTPPESTEGTESTDTNTNTDTDNEQDKSNSTNNDNNNDNDNDNKDDTTTLSQNPGSDGGTGTGGDTNGTGGTGDNGTGSGTGGADTGSGSGGGLLSETQGGTEGDELGGGNPFLEGTGDSTVASAGENVEANPAVQTVDDEASEDDLSAQTVYLSLGNVAGGDTAGGSVSGSGTTGGSGGKMLEIEEQPFYYYVILIVALAALFVGGGMYRSLRFRKDIAR